MKTLVIYESVYGNTKAIAQAIGAALPGEVRVVELSAVRPGELGGYELLFVGAPTYGGRPTETVQSWLTQLAANALAGIKFATFDTRLTARWVRIFGYAAPKMVDTLRAKGGTPVGAPGGFFVKGREGPLAEGEEARAAAWAQDIAAQAA